MKGPEWSGPDKAPTRQPIIIVIDSLTALANHLSPWLPEKESLREAVSAFLRAAQGEDNRNAMVVILSEYDFATGDSILSESYLCDIEVVLSSEPLEGKSRNLLNIISASGYDYHVSRSDKDPNQIDITETRSFCRVLKSRVSDNQSRRCLYEMRAKQGVVFLEEFPGDGAVRLFQENAPQRNAWDEFITHEVPRTYPSLRSSRFDAITVQRTFGTLRHLFHHPERTDLLLGAFDSYWIDLFRLRGERFALERFLIEKGILAETALEKNAATVTDLQGAIRRGQNISAAVKNLLKTVNVNEPSEHLITESSATINAFSGEHGLFSRLDPSKVKIFGRDIRECNFVGEAPSGNNIFSIPYNNNVSFMVFRRERMIAIRDKLKNLADGEKQFKEGVLEGGKILKTLRNDEKPDDKLMESLWQRFLRTAQPKTWEEILYFCMHGPNLLEPAYAQSSGQAIKKKYHLVIETGIYDTLAATFLELVWSCGGRPLISSDFCVTNGDGYLSGFEESVRMATDILAGFAAKKVIPENSTLRPHIFARIYNEEENEKQTEPRSEFGERDWLFARHWHSTLVHLLTDTKKGDLENSFVWMPKDTCDLDVMEMPLTLRYLIDYPTKNKIETDVLDTIFGFSTRGDWHLAILRGSENESLGYDLINNLMSQPKIIERAFTGAALPTLNQFYEMHGSLPAINIKRRTGKSVLPKNSFEWFKRRFEAARSRTDIADYRMCMNSIAPLIEKALKDTGMENAQNEIAAIVKTIESLKGQRQTLY